MSMPSSGPPSPDHPRSRGVYDLCECGYFRPEGSSPLARGLRSTGCGRASDAGIIPARAGFTRASSSARRDIRIIPARAGFTDERPGGVPPRGDHPRSRGVYVFVFCSYVCSTGSSPLARGLPPSPPHSGMSGRIIPARAGFTVFRVFVSCFVWDHPRSRGVYLCVSSSPVLAVGSSPLARGLPAPGAQCSPAGEDHPRSRGVYNGRIDAESMGGGSSPLARGLRTSYLDRRGTDRIIPARAGFTDMAVGISNLPTDHPRSRGVYARIESSEKLKDGSSPLARGLLFHTPNYPSRGRIIPARAGFTSEDFVLALFLPDHPRSRGVYDTNHAAALDICGSSPLARGLLYTIHYILYYIRIIPARAGFTSVSPGMIWRGMDHPRSRGVYSRPFRTTQ